ncbi:MAG: hypothetical protein HJJLKODD_01099 [Phycisphaerae bacterium]|nr:hypothetical protein [Phycisphaerae bacterium]
MSTGLLMVSFGMMLATNVTSQSPLPEPAAGERQIQANAITQSTYLGGNQQDTFRDVAADQFGNVYVTGGSGCGYGTGHCNNNFMKNAAIFNPALKVVDTLFTSNFKGTHDVSLLKLDLNGNIVWYRMLGGRNYDRAYALEVDSAGDVYLAGRAGQGYPVTPGAAYTTFLGPDNYVTGNAYGPQDGFITKVDGQTGVVLWSTFVPSPDNSFIRDIAVNAAGEVYAIVTSVTMDAPYVTTGPERPGGNDAIAVKLAADGSHIIWARYLGGSLNDIEVPSIALDSLDYVYVMGSTNSPDILDHPETAYDPVFNNGAANSYYDLYLAKLSPDGSEVLYDTYLGGSEREGVETHELAVDDQDNVIVAAGTSSADFFVGPIIGFQTAYAGGNNTNPPNQQCNSNYAGDGFIAKFIQDPTGSEALIFSAGTYLGGARGESIEGVSTDTLGNIYVSGASCSVSDFPKVGAPTQSGNKGKADVFFTILSPDLQHLSYSTLWGGKTDDYGRGNFLDESGPMRRWHIIGATTSTTQWPLIDALQTVFGGGSSDGILISINLN